MSDSTTETGTGIGNDDIFTEDQLNQLSSTLEISSGLFYNTLKQNSKEIKASQAAQLAEDVEFALRNAIIESKSKLRVLYRQNETLINQFLPSQTTSLKLAEGFNAATFTTSRINNGLQIRNESIRLTIALNEYERLIGKKFKQ